MAKLSPDWELIEKEYRGGVYSVREIGKRYETAESSIRAHAKMHDWQRDLTQRVNREVRTRLVRSVDMEKFAAATTDEEIVAVAADTLVQVVTVHRRDIGQCRSIVEVLFKQLAEAASERDDIEASIIEETKEDKTSERRNRMLRAVSLPTHAATMRELAQALRGVVWLERQVFNLDNQPNEDTEPDNQLTATIAGKIIANLNALAAG